ncbi:MAG: hypothetical protein ACI9QD_000193 [Thermoproteota archaeon]|jgi:hypothetical protein
MKIFLIVFVLISYNSHHFSEGERMGGEENLIQLIKENWNEEYSQNQLKKNDRYKKMNSICDPMNEELNEKLKRYFYPSK